MINIRISENAEDLGKAAAKAIATLINKTIEEKGDARIVLSTGMSQFETLENLIKEDVSWQYVEMFHLDEYEGISEEHPASFRKYLRERFTSRVNLKAAYFVEGEASIPKLSALLKEREIDVGVIGIGENGHIAFNDPPADFDSMEFYKTVILDRRCREQQVGEGWFGSVEEVPEKAISMTVHGIMSCKHIVSAVPHSVKAEAVFRTITEKPSPLIPAAILKTHPSWQLFLDRNSAGKLLQI